MCLFTRKGPERSCATIRKRSTYDKLPFYDDILANQHALANPKEPRQAAQRSLICTFVPSDGNLGLLQTLRGRVGEYMKQQTLFADFAWVSATLTECLYFSFGLYGRYLAIV